MIDADAQGNVGTSLDASSPGNLFHLMIEGRTLGDLIESVRPNLDLWQQTLDWRRSTCACRP